MCSQTRCQHVVCLDVSRISPVADYFVIATGTSARQMRTVIDDAVELGQGRGRKALSTAGTDGEQWMLADFVDVVVHVFGDASRLYYDLDGLWGDAMKVDWAKEAPPAETPGQ